jgi:hypothetical protein
MSGIYIILTMVSDNTIFMIVFGLIIVGILYYLLSSEPIHNEGKLQMKENYTSNNGDDSDDQSSNTQTQNSQSDVDSDSNMDSDSSLETIRERAMGRNGPHYRRMCGLNKYKHSSYRANEDDNNYNDINCHFKVENILKNQIDKYSPIDESNEGSPSPINIENNKGTEKEKYDIDGYLPKEKEKDWFETIEAVDVKNSHLINIYRPIGANTIGSSHKNSTYDLRGTDSAVCPKFVVSPWNQSSIEPDRSMKSLCGVY